MRLTELNGKTICLLGFGREGQATLKIIEEHAPDAEVTIADANADLVIEGKKHWQQLGNGWLKNLEKFDVIIASPGIPPQKEIDAVADRVTSATQIFLEEVTARGGMVIGITGSKGKSTTTSLIAAALKEGKRDVILAGNIGTPALTELSKIKKGTIVALEMSSFQLRLLTLSPHIAVITSFFPEHLDYHGTVDDYWNAKANIAQFQKKDDAVIFNTGSPDASKMAMRSPGEKIGVAPELCPVDIADTKLIGEHNRENLALAYAAAMFVGVEREACVQAFKNFEPLPHRLQSLGVHHGVEWVDDAISTTPESTIAALRALGDKVKTLILGGQDRGLEFDELAKEIVEHSKVETIIIFPGSGPRMREAIEKQNSKISFADASTMQDAVTIAKEKTPKGTICLLSTASPSYNMFKNFEEKGDAFAQAIKK